MSVIMGAIAPHGDEIVEELVGELDDESRKLAEAMKILADRVFLKNPDVIVVAIPHNLRIYGHLAVITTRYASGTWIGEKGEISVSIICDRDFAWSIYREAIDAGLPIVAVNFGAVDGEFSNMPLDWGTIIPLWFIKKRYKATGKETPKTIIVTPTREIPWEKLVRFGEIIHYITQRNNRRVVFIASADQGHAHDPNGPYGYDKASEEYDEFVVEIVRNNRLDRLLELDPKFVEKAKPDSLWQMLILYGVIKSAGLRNTLCVYGCPTYYGMLVAMFE